MCVAAAASVLLVAAAGDFADRALAQARDAGTKVAASAGTYTGSEHQNGNGLVFYVASTGKQLQDLSIPAVGLTCSPGGATPGDHIIISTVGIKATGAFSVKQKQTGLFSDPGSGTNFPATYTYTFAGEIGTTATGTYREDVTYNNGVAKVTCTSGTQPWSATRDSQPTQTASAPPPGSYSGSENQNGNGLSLYVSGNSTTIQDLSIPAVGLECSPGNTKPGDHITIDSIAIKGKTTFSTTVTNTGIFPGGYPAKYTYTFTGHTHGTNNTPTERMGGTYREDVTYSNGAESITCTSNLQSWQGTRESQPAQGTEAPPPGSYSGSENQNGNGLSLYVSGNSTTIQDLSIPAVGLTCTPGGASPGDHISLDSIPLTGETFESTSTQTGVFEGFTATFETTLTGHVHGTNNTPAERLAGSYREDVTYNNGSSTVMCTSNLQSWRATRDTQPTQTTASPPPGTYKGTENQNGNGLSFSVASGGESLQKLTIPAVGLECTSGGGSPGDHIKIGTMAISAPPEDAFAAESTETRTFQGFTGASVTDVFRGHFHGTNDSGEARAAGTYRENVTYKTGSTTVTCTSNVQSWRATLP